MKKGENIKTGITTIIFDVGGVLVETNWSRIKEAMKKRYGFSIFIYSDYPKEFSKKFAKLSTGKSKFENFLKLVARNEDKGNFQKIIQDYLRFHKQNVRLNKQLFKLLAKLKQKYLLLCLTDVQKINFNSLQEKGVYKLFRRVYASCNTGIKKPDKRIFKLILRNHKLIPKNCIFVDNMPENILVAKKLGMKAVLFKNNKQLVQDLKNLGIKI